MLFRSFDDLGIVFENVDFSCLYDIRIQVNRSKEVSGDGIVVKAESDYCEMTASENEKRT